MKIFAFAWEEFFHQRHADSLRDPAFDLSFDQGWIDGPAHIVRGGDLEHLHRAKLDIDFNLGEVCPKSEHGVRYALAILIQRAGRRIESGFGRHHVSVVIER